MSTTLFAPLWFIELFAPQYPEGLGMQIWSNRITGDVDNINILNHYIGMKHIIPNEIPELRILPTIFLVIVISGLLTALFNSKILMRIWVAFFLVSGGIAFGDFYMWEYNYGHDLNPDAPIKVPGMHYQPPLIGSKTLLNISAYSYPDIAGVCVFIAIALAILALFDKKLLQLKYFKGLASVMLLGFFLR
jgi:copper chaperone NosL